MMKIIKEILVKVFKYGSLILWSLVILLPILTIFFGSFKTYDEFMNTPGIMPPENFLNFENYKIAFINGKMLVGFTNTFILILFGVIGSIIIGSMVAYIINRFNFKYKKLILAMYLLVSIVPMEVSQVSTFKIIDAMGIYNTRLAPIILYLGADVLMVYIYLQMLEKIPIELDRAAMLEGANYFQIYTKVIFPLIKPATATVCMMKVIAIYNDFYIPFLYMPGENLNTISTTLFRFMGPLKTEWQLISAAIIISMIPMIILYLFLQKHIYQSITSGSIK
ncbi:carbohydrate ABC transporter permease [Romboutsia sp.]|uniref:carbohydrate ABC transporter permease n=1 Tax=Romboutsia sp. TaxID=1965302 RepID=UPI003F2C9D09